MGLLSEDNNKPVVGNLRSFTVLKNTEYVKSVGGGNTVWAEMWKYRGGFPFRISTGLKTKVIFLTDVKPIFGFDVAVGEKTGPKGRYPLIDTVASMSITGTDPETGREVKNGDTCLFEKALGRSPRITWVATILDLTAYKTKKGEEKKWSARLITIPSNSSVLNQLMAVAEAQQRDMKYAMFTVQRGVNEKTPKIGDSWTFLKYVQSEDLSEIVGLEEAVAKIDIEKAYPVLSEEQAKAVLRIHQSVAKKFPNIDSGNLKYDETAMALILSGAKLPDVEKAEKRAELIAALPEDDDLPSGSSGLEDLDDIPLSGNPFADL